MAVIGCDRRNYRGNDRTRDACAVDAVKIQDILESKGVFKRGLAVVSGEPLGEEDLIPVYTPDHHICVADVNSEKHAAPP